MITEIIVVVVVLVVIIEIEVIIMTIILITIITFKCISHVFQFQFDSKGFMIPCARDSCTVSEATNLTSEACKSPSGTAKQTGSQTTGHAYQRTRPCRCHASRHGPKSDKGIGVQHSPVPTSPEKEGEGGL